MEREIKGMVKADGADLVGIASVDRFEQALPGCKPTDIIPQAKTVIALAARMPRGIIESGNLRLVTNAWNAINPMLNSVAFKCTRFLEDKGYTAAVIPPLLPLSLSEKRGLSGELSLKHAAAMAGIGVIGFSGLLITPQFGPRQRLAALVTDAPLKADPLLENDFCVRCQEKHCIKACPVGAMKGEKSIDKLLCLDQYQKFGGRALIRFIRKLIEAPSKEEKLKLLKFPAVLELLEIHQFMRVGGVACVECLRACPVGK